ncbi:hypothetical protein HX049_07880 [Myroides odoratimimus]|uniref:hypothetical protein n=1 Tax=Myroides odoratimimus TaxID=76832 RepID=UPI0025749053|nr:hypothetical protein [Myroides odoratimimus]MDM1397092.1 hypothetical protein [Myroides odoratimimus]MDX4973689.1 hypothetical protein [Myroides odoratimimus]
MMEKQFVTKQFELIEELVMVDGKKVGYQYTLKIIGPNMNIENYTLDALIKQKCCSDKRKLNDISLPVLLLMIGYLLLLIIAIIPSIIVTIEPSAIISRSMDVSFGIIRIILAGYLVWFSLFFKSVA